MLSRLFGREKPVRKTLGLQIFQISREDMEKGNKTFPLPKDNRIDPAHEQKAKAYCWTYLNPTACESAGWALNKNIDQDMVCSWSVETPTAEAAGLIRSIGKGAEGAPQQISTIAGVFTEPVAQVTEAAGKISTCHHMMLPGSMTIEEFYKQEKEARTAKAQPQQVVQLVQVVPAPPQAPAPVPSTAPLPAPSPGETTSKSLKYKRSK